MTDAKLIENIAEEYSKGTELFVVKVKVTKNNVITVTIDGDNGVKVDDCIALSKHIESKLDRDKEDFELTVTSFGADEYFSMPRQYNKNIGKNVEVVLNDGEKINGQLNSFDGKIVTLIQKKQKEPLSINFEDIKQTKVILTF